MYGLLRELHITRARGAPSAPRSYLFNPLTYSLAFTFMSDSYLVAGVIASAYCFVPAMNREGPDSRWIEVGSLLAGLTFLIRQQAVFVVIAVRDLPADHPRAPWNRVGLRRRSAALRPSPSSRSCTCSGTT